MRQRNLQAFIEPWPTDCHIGTDFYLHEQTGLVPYHHPVKTDLCICCICLQGEARGQVDLTPFSLKASEMSVIAEGQLIEHDYVSDDFRGYCLLMSPRFLGGLGLPNSLQAYMALQDNPVIPLTPRQLESLTRYFDMTRSLLRSRNPFKLETVRHLTCAFFYGMGYYFHQMAEDKVLSAGEQLTRQFLRHVRQHYRRERKVAFYAGLMHLSPGYLSTVVRTCTGRTASEWIERHVAQEAKALLKSTNMTVQQISNELNFPSQSFFGKFFKRLTGLSPKEYRRS